MKGLSLCVTVGLVALAVTYQTVPGQVFADTSVRPTFTAQQIKAGAEVAKDLNRRYDDTRHDCKGTNHAVYYCSGVILRYTGATSDYHAWNPSPDSINRNGVSMSFSRRDMGYKRDLIGQGLIFKRADQSSLAPLEVRCVFPISAVTNNRSDSCNGTNDHPALSRPCKDQHIRTRPEWYRYFKTIPYNNNNAAYYLCSFEVDRSNFNLSIQVRPYFDPLTIETTPNEMIIAAWPQNIPERLPLEAILYSSASALSGAQFIQQDFFQETGNFLPVVKYSTLGGRVFVYNEEDQITHTGIKPPADPLIIDDKVIFQTQGL